MGYELAGRELVRDAPKLLAIMFPAPGTPRADAGVPGGRSVNSYLVTSTTTAI